MAESLNSDCRSYAGYVGTYSVEDQSQIKILQEMEIKIDAAGPGPDQDQARPHQVAFDPTGQYMVSPDLGADLIRTFRIAPDHQVKEIEGLSLPKGSFPRHAAFVALKDRVQLYVLLQELNELLVYKVEYLAAGGFAFTKEDGFPLVTGTDGKGIVHSNENYLKASHLAISVSAVSHPFLIQRG